MAFSVLLLAVSVVCFSAASTSNNVGTSCLGGSCVTEDQSSSMLVTNIQHKSKVDVHKSRTTVFEVDLTEGVDFMQMETKYIMQHVKQHEFECCEWTIGAAFHTQEAVGPTHATSGIAHNATMNGHSIVFFPETAIDQGTYHEDQACEDIDRARLAQAQLFPGDCATARIQVTGDNGAASGEEGKGAATGSGSESLLQMAAIEKAVQETLDSGQPHGVKEDHVDTVSAYDYDGNSYNAYGSTPASSPQTPRKPIWTFPKVRFNIRPFRFTGQWSFFHLR